jgi:hypothetical protein
MIQPPQWSKDDLEKDVALATELFRTERLEEPLEEYLEAFDEYQGNVASLFETTIDLTELDETAIQFLCDPKLFAAFRYLAGPPISNDDLKTVAEVRSLNASQIRKNPEIAGRIVGVIRTAMDRRRFPWVREDRKPTEVETNAAVLASAALMAAQRVGTDRRNKGKKAQEGLVDAALTGAGLIKAAKRRVATITDAPEPGHFCGESYLGGRKADFLVRLWDKRIMPIECKVSNSAINSVKRLNNDAAAKAEAWLEDFGVRQVVPVAVLGGVYKLRNLDEAQHRGLALFWAHDLKSLTDWIETTRTPLTR